LWKGVRPIIREAGEATDGISSRVRVRSELESDLYLCLGSGGLSCALEEIKGLGSFGSGRVGSLFELVGDLEDAGSAGGECSYLSGDVCPVDARGAGPEVIVFGAVVVMEMELRDARLEEFEGFVDADVLFGTREMGMANVEADADAVEVADAEYLQNVLRGGDFVLKVFDEDADAEGMGEGLEVLDGGEGVFEGAGVPGVALLAEVEDTGFDGDLLGRLEGALDLVHCGDAVRLFGVDEIDVRGDVA